MSTESTPIQIKDRLTLSIDPGTTESAYVLYRIEDGALLDKHKVNNDLMLDIMSILFQNNPCMLSIEMVACYGMAVGKTVFETCLWTGRFIERWSMLGGPYMQVYRRDVKMHLCNIPRAKDSNVRQAIIDMYPPDGGGRNPQVGTKRQPGPLFGVSKDIWAALGVAITAGHTIADENTLAGNPMVAFGDTV